MTLTRLFSGFYYRKDDRRTWTTDPNLNWLFFTYLWVNDDFGFNRILPVSPRTECLQWSWMLFPLLSKYVRL